MSPPYVHPVGVHSIVSAAISNPHRLSPPPQCLPRQCPPSPQAPPSSEPFLCVVPFPHTAGVPVCAPQDGAHMLVSIRSVPPLPSGSPVGPPQPVGVPIPVVTAPPSPPVRGPPLPGPLPPLPPQRPLFPSPLGCRCLSHPPRLPPSDPCTPRRPGSSSILFISSFTPVPFTRAPDRPP